MKENKKTKILTISNDIINEYNSYFDDSEGVSLYNKRFTSFNKISYREKLFINLIFKKLISRCKNNQIVILDYGCGDGRYIELFEEIAEKAKSRGIKLKLISYDPSHSAIISYYKKLEKLNYSLQYKSPYNDNHEFSNGYKYATFYNHENELTIELIQGNISDNNDYIAELLGGELSIDIALSMLGVISHIPIANYRISVIKMLNSLVKTGGYLVSSLPLYGCFYKELILYRMLREKKSLMKYCGHDYDLYKNIIELAAEEDDIYYHRFDKDTKKYVNIYYHLYNLKSLKKELKLSGLNDTKIHILMSIYNLNTSFTFLSFVDNIISWFADKFKKYFSNFISRNCAYVILTNRKK